MPSEMGSQDLLKKYYKQLEKVHDQVKDEPPEIPMGGNLPDGIEGGVAQLISIKFDEYKKGANKGKPYFQAQGMVVRPKVFHDQLIEGMRTMIMEPFCDTPGNTRSTLKEHYVWILNQLKLLAGPDWEVPESIEELPAAIDELVDESPYFRFRTWKGDKQTEGKYKGKEPRTQHTWMGFVEFDAPDESNAVRSKVSTNGDSGDSDDDDDHDEVDEVDEEVPVKKTKDKNKSKKEVVTTKVKESKEKPGLKTKPVKKAVDPEPEDDEDEEVEESTLERLERMTNEAYSGDEDSQVALADWAKELGIKEKTIGKAAGWPAVGNLIKDALEAEEDEEDEEEKEEEEKPVKGKKVTKKVKEPEPEEEDDDEDDEDDDDTPAFIPSLGEVYGCHLMDPVKKIRKKKATDCEVLKVDLKRGVATVRDLATDKKFDVPFDAVDETDDD